jgi:chromate transporter
MEPLESGHQDKTAAGVNLLGVHELIVLFGCGSIMFVFKWTHNRGVMNEQGSLAIGASTLMSLLSNGTIGVTGPLASPSLAGIFSFFLKVGSVLFGSGYVLLAFIRADLVQRFEWITETQLLDAVAVGQVTPGPVFTTATFIGYLIAGSQGAVVATIGIFLPAFFFVAISGPLIPKMRKSIGSSAFLDGLNVASLSLMAVVTLQLARTTLVDIGTVVIAIVSSAVLFRYKVNSVWLILVGGLIGLGAQRM